MKNLENRREGRGRENWLNSESVTQTKGKGVGGAAPTLTEKRSTGAKQQPSSRPTLVTSALCCWPRADKTRRRNDTALDSAGRSSVDRPRLSIPKPPHPLVPSVPFCALHPLTQHQPAVNKAPANHTPCLLHPPQRSLLCRRFRVGSEPSSVLRSARPVITEQDFLTFPVTTRGMCWGCLLCTSSIAPSHPLLCCNYDDAARLSLQALAFLQPRSSLVALPRLAFFVSFAPDTGLLRK